MPPSYDNKNIWILGASSGIGRALAITLSQQGANLAVSARSKSALHTLNTELGGHHHVIPCDVGDYQSVTQATQSLTKVFNTLHSVVLLSAVYTPTRCDSLDISATEHMVQVNVMGAFYVVHTILPIFQSQGHGQIALCASVAGLKGLPNGQPYSATKSAIINLAESLKSENPTLDIKLINPGFVQTPLTDKNSFKMPFIIPPEQAGKQLAKGLQQKGFEIHFPKKFTRIMKCINHLPYSLYFKIATRL